jgi:DNA-binding response OmpR family regulator
VSHLLIVEDDEGLREGLRRNFEYEGYRVSTASDGPSGLEAALSAEPHLVILDVMLPGLNGFDVCRRLRLPVERACPHAHGAEGRARARPRLRGGADDYVLKPFSIQELSGARARLRWFSSKVAVSRLRLGTSRSTLAGRRRSERAGP